MLLCTRPEVGTAPKSSPQETTRDTGEPPKN